MSLLNNTVPPVSAPSISKEFYPDGKLFSEIHFESTAKGREGHHKAFFEDGTLQEDFRSLNGVRSGIGKWYYADGTLQTEQNYANNVLDGICRWYNNDGTINLEVEYKQGRVDGIKRTFYMDGTVANETTYLDQTMSGPARQYTQQGKLKWESSYVDGKINGDLKWYNKDGSALLTCQVTPDGVKNLKLSFNNDPTDLMDWAGIVLAAHDFDDLEKLADQLQKNKTIDPSNGHWQLENLIDGITRGLNLIYPNQGPLQIDLIQQWVNAKPQTVAPLVALADAQLDQAWEIRGGDYAQSVTQDRMDRFEDMLHQSQTTLTNALGIDPNFLPIYPIAIKVLLGLNSDRASIDDLFNKAVSIDPYYPTVYIPMVTTLLPRWGGAPGAVEAFADRAVTLTKDKEGEGYYARIAIMALKYVDKEFINEYNFSWGRMKQGFEDLNKIYPNSPHYLSYYAWLAGQYNDKEATHRAIGLMGPWNNLMEAFKSKRDFDNLNKWSGQEKDLNFPGDKPILVAAQKGDLDALKDLLNKGANINEQDKDGKTPLYTTIENLHSDAAEFLINVGADGKLATANGETPITAAAQYHMAPIVELLLQKGSSVEGRDVFHPQAYTPLLAAASNGEVDICDFLLKHGAQLNATLGDYQTPLHWAAGNGHQPVVELLLKQPNVQVNAQDFWKQTPLHNAVKAENSAIVQLLLDAGAKKDIKDYQGKTPLDLAHELRNDDIVNILKKSP